tara:strand:- start:1752 stop:3224 length:1473 start_codon:yes stop_codon:yes gene_type:complete
MIEILERTKDFKHKTALLVDGKEITYSYLHSHSDLIASYLLDDKEDLYEEPIAFLIEPDDRYIYALWGIWKAGGMAIPLSLAAKKEELEHFISDTKVKRVICSKTSKANKNLLTIKNLDFVFIEDLHLKEIKKLPDLDSERKAMVLYTSGTTSRPKGVVSSHKNIFSQIVALVEAWQWKKEDHIPLFLPLHHIHGIINSLLCPLYQGAKVTMLGSFNFKKLTEEMMKNHFSVFTAVPTVYFSLLENLEKNTNIELIKRFKKMRLMMSGSAALAPEIHKKWQDLTGQEILERYGMTEIGMALSNPYKGERRPGFVGTPLPKVEVRLEDENGKEINAEGVPGEVLIKGPQVFKEYLNQPQKTKDSFTDSWFRTGDVASIEEGYFKILGRDSIDIIKTGGYKISALEIEDALLKNKKIKECAVIAIDDVKWGEIIGAAIVTKDKEKLELGEVQEWCNEYLSDYKLPRKLLNMDDLPKNSMGKIMKTKIKGLFS